MGLLSGKVAVVCGASRGLGKGIAYELGTAGAVVYVAGRSLTSSAEGLPGSLQATADDVTAAGGTAIPVVCDFLQDSETEALFARIAKEQGRLDILVNSVFNAYAFAGSIGKKFWETPVAIWRQVVDVGTRSAYVASYYAVPLLFAAGQGLIVNVSSAGAERYFYNVAYGAGKAALDKLTKDMAEELRDRNIAVISLWPNVNSTEYVVDSTRAAVGEGRRPLADLDTLETPRYQGRAIVALATDARVMERSGQRFWTGRLGKHYGFADENGRTHPAMRW